MILIEKKYNLKEEDLNVLTENTVKLLTNFTSRLEGSSFMMEYYSYIDNVIAYFKQKQITLMNLAKTQIDRIYSNRKNAIKVINKNEQFDSFIVRKPNYKYFKLPMVDTIMTDPFITQWNLSSNDKIIGYANCCSAGYNKIAKKITNNEVSDVVSMTSLINIITDEYEIDSKKKFIDYINNLIIPRDDLEYINKYIDYYIISLQELKTKSINEITKQNEDIKFENKILYAIKMIDVKNLYVKNVLNILLNVYMIKISVFNFSNSKPITESVINITDMLYSRKYFNEAYEYIENGFDKKLIIDASINKDVLSVIKDYVTLRFTAAINYIDEYYDINSEKIKNHIGLFTLYNINDITKKYNMTDNVDRYTIDNFLPNVLFNNSYNNYIYIDKKNKDDIKKLIYHFSHKNEIKESLKYDFDKIISYINELNTNNTQIKIRLFDRYYDELSIYVKTESDTIKEYLLNNYNINIDEYYYSMNENIIKNIKIMYNNNDIIEKAERYVLLKNQYIDMMTNNEYIEKNLKENKYIDDLLLTYLANFGKKLFKINLF